MIVESPGASPQKRSGDFYVLLREKYRVSAKSAEITSHIKNFLKEFRKKIAFFGKMCYNS